MWLLRISRDFYVLSYNIRKARIFDLLHILNTLTSQFVNKFKFYTDFQLFYILRVYPVSPLHSQTKMQPYRCLRNVKKCE